LKLKNLTIEQRGELADSVLTAYDEGDGIKDQAIKLGVTPPTVYRLLFAQQPIEWAAAQSARAQHHMEEAKEMMRDAPDTLTLQKGEKLCNQYKWELERLSAKIYGPKLKEPEQLQAVQININLGREKIVNEIPEEHPKPEKAA
jgi:hypothetical protein